jgi:hypothetical protein
MDEAVGVKNLRLIRPIQLPKSAFAGFRFPPEVILIAVRWYLRYGLSYRDLEELLAAGYRSRPCDPVSMGPEVHAVVGGRGPALSSQRR